MYKCLLCGGYGTHYCSSLGRYINRYDNEEYYQTVNAKIKPRSVTRAEEAYQRMRRSIEQELQESVDVDPDPSPFRWITSEPVYSSFSGVAATTANLVSDEFDSDEDAEELAW